jgi:shikimate dehydrogenase
MKSDDSLPISKDWITPPLRIYDTLYKKDFTPLVQVARERGCLAEDGLAMLLHQGALSFEIWSKKPAPLESMRTVLNLATGRNL